VVEARGSVREGEALSEAEHTFEIGEWWTRLSLVPTLCVGMQSSTLGVATDDRSLPARA
jgi:hypothetical protein